ncbi:MAG: hydroxymethylglutaryl-CoA synthase family protein [Dehalococcoidia bacterium]|nr:MAG: hydroxymethylglutaryl-CoA synthase family protein [Dehalococcoidia bacterium]
MAGITSYGAYIPLYRLNRPDIQKAWDSMLPIPGEKAVAGHDEDSITMAVAAARDCMTGIDPQRIDRLYFASTTSPYKEKQAASVVAGALALSKETLTMDFAGSLRAGTNALRAAVDAVQSGSAKGVLVTCAETRLGAPSGDKEMSFGDGAAAVLVANSGVAVDIVGSVSVFQEFHDMWRSDKDTFVRFWEERFVREAGYLRVVPPTVAQALQKYNLTPGDIAKAAVYAPDPRLLGMAAGRMGFEPMAQIQDPLYMTVGNTGSALPLMILVAALEDAKAGDNLLCVGYGDGCDVFVLKANEAIDKIKDRRGIKHHLASKRMIPNYLKYVQWRGLMETQPPPRPPLNHISVPALWRDMDWGLSLHGVKCKNCGTPQYPPQRVCVICQAQDDFEPYNFADKKAVLTSFSHDNLAASIDPPTTIAAVDFEEGGRIIFNMVDRDPQEVKTGMPVEVTFRKVHYFEGIHNYWWKCAPIRC